MNLLRDLVAEVKECLIVFILDSEIEIKKMMKSLRNLVIVIGVVGLKSLFPSNIYDYNAHYFWVINAYKDQD